MMLSRNHKAGPAVGIICCALISILLSTCNIAAATVALPDSRAWEMVSPLSKNGADVIGGGLDSGGGVAQAAADGDAVTYLATGSFADPRGASVSQYLSTRHAPEGWSTQNITIPSISGTAGLAGKGAPYKAFSLDLSLGLVQNGVSTASEAPIENPPLAPNMPAGYQNFYMRSSNDGSLQALLTFTPAQPAHGFYMNFEGASSDMRHVVVSSASALTLGAVVEGSESNLYEWTNGEWQPVNVMPNAVGGKTKPEAALGSGGGESHTVSDDGSRVFWSNALVRAPALLVREDGMKSVQIDAPQGGEATPEETPDTLFQTASSDGARAFFTSHAPLTSDARTGSLPCPSCTRLGSELYEFEVNSGRLKDISVDPDLADQNGAEVQGMLGASEDGLTYVYFVASHGILGWCQCGSVCLPSPGDPKPCIYGTGERPANLRSASSRHCQEMTYTIGVRRCGSEQRG